MSNENDAIGELKSGVRGRARRAGSNASGAISLAWYRGQHAATEDTFETIAKEFPEIRKVFYVGAGGYLGRVIGGQK